MKKITAPKLSLALALLASFQIQASTMCNRPAQSIAEVQGAGHKSPLLGEKVTVEGVVVGDFQGQDALEGFYLQSLKADDDPRTSEAVFVHHSKTDVSLGNHVVVHGTVAERHDMTQIHSAIIGDVCADQVPLPIAMTINLPLSDKNLEHLEAMRVTLPQSLTVTDIYHFAKHGQLTLSKNRLFSPTQVAMPGKAAQKVMASNKLNQVLIDDGRNKNFVQQQVNIDGVVANFSAKNPLRLGFEAKQVTGVLDFAFGQYKVQVTESIKYTSQSSPRLEKVTYLEGGVKVAAFNIENLFSSIDSGKEICGPKKSWGCRGADSQAEFNRQMAKIVAVIQNSSAHVVALQELENNAVESIETLVNALNKNNGKQWRFVNTGALANDVIKVGIIYQADHVKTVGSFAVLDDRAVKSFKVNKHRPIVLQGFETQTGETFQVASIHLKSKSCRDAEGKNKAQGDGQGCYAGERALAAKQMVAWLKEDPTKLKIQNTVLAGDFNSYGREDSMRILEAAGFTDLGRHYNNDTNWSTSYKGKVGALDHIMVSDHALVKSKSVHQWHINSDEFDGFGYNSEDLDKGVKKPREFYQTNPFSSSDHDVVVAGFDFD